MNEVNIRNLETAARGLRDFLDQVVFVGGATVEFYATAPGAPASRPTMDVDCIIESYSYNTYSELEDALRHKGFQNDQTEGAPLCRWIFENITIDVMPTDSDVLGFSNRWYAEGIRHTTEVALPNGQRIKILDSPYFLGAKFEAAKNRGWADLRTSTDFEDVVYVLRNRGSIIDDIKEAKPVVREYILETLHQMLARDDIDEAIGAVLDFGEPEGTPQMIRRLMEEISSLGDSLMNK